MTHNIRVFTAPRNAQVYAHAKRPPPLAASFNAVSREHNAALHRDPDNTPATSHNAVLELPEEVLVQPNRLLLIGGLSHDENNKVGNAQFVIGVSVEAGAR